MTMTDEEIIDKAVDKMSTNKRNSIEVQIIKAIKEAIRLTKKSILDHPEREALVYWHEVADKLSELIPDTLYGGDIDDILKQAVENVKQNTAREIIKYIGLLSVVPPIKKHPAMDFRRELDNGCFFTFPDDEKALNELMIILRDMLKSKYLGDGK